MFRRAWVVGALATIVACGGSSTDTTATDGGTSGDGGGSNDGSSSSDGTTSNDSASGDAASSDSSMSDSAPIDGGAAVNHRVDDSQCSATAPAGNCTITLGACTMDSQCAAGVNGRCVQTTHGAQMCSCTYDTCGHDTDCAAGKLCACHGSAYTAGGGNTCIDGNCRVDSDCGAGKYCSPSHGTTGCGVVTGYYCHTASDTCINDSDCTGGSQVCGWSAVHTRWECQQQQLCP